MQFLHSFMIGLSLAAIPGPIFFELMKRTLTRGFWSGVLLAVGEFLGNFILILLIYFGVANFFNTTAAQVMLYFIGSIILFWLAKVAWQIKTKDIEQKYDTAIGQRGSIVTGFGIAVSSPIVIAFWISLSGSYFLYTSSHPGAVRGAVVQDFWIDISGLWSQFYLSPDATVSLNIHNQ